MKFTKDEIRKAMLLYAVTDQMWLKEGETLSCVVEEVFRSGKRIWPRMPLRQRQRN